MGELVLVRHAQASFGSEDYDRLSRLGHQQAHWLAEYFMAHDLAFEHVVRGDLRRHRETAEPICAALGLPEPVIDPRLDEFHYDVLETAYIANTNRTPSTNRTDFLEAFPEIWVRWEAGELAGQEAFEAFEARVWAALDAAFRPGTRTLVVTSGGVIGMALRRVLQLDARGTADLALNIHNASVHRFEHEGGRFRLSLFNASPHLDGARGHARTYV